MYMKDKTNRITLRLNDEMFDYVKDNADLMGVSPSEFLRMVIHMSMRLSRQGEREIKDRMVAGRENDKTDIDNIV